MLRRDPTEALLIFAAADQTPQHQDDTGFIVAVSIKLEFTPQVAISMRVGKLFRS